MSDSKADDCRKILDNGKAIALYRNELGSYTAHVVDVDALLSILGEEIDGPNITDDFTPSAALYRLSEKGTTGRIA